MRFADRMPERWDAARFSADLQRAEPEDDSLYGETGPTQAAYVCPTCDEQVCVCWMYDT